MTWKLSRSSKDKLKSCDVRLKLIVNKMLEVSPIDFGVSCGHRSIEEQQELFKQGFSQLDGVNKKSYHNHMPSKAVDLYAYVDGKASYKREHMALLAGVFLTIAHDMGVEIEWGGDWKGFQDMPHYNIKE